MAIYSPGLKHPIHVAVVSGPAYVIDDFVAAVVDYCLSDASSESIQHFIPGGLVPVPFATRPHPFEWIENAFGVLDLIERGGTLGAVAAT